MGVSSDAVWCHARASGRAGSIPTVGNEHERTMKSLRGFVGGRAAVGAIRTRAPVPGPTEVPLPMTALRSTTAWDREPARLPRSDREGRWVGAGPWFHRNSERIPPGREAQPILAPGGTVVGSPWRVRCRWDPDRDGRRAMVRNPRASRDPDERAPVKGGSSRTSAADLDDRCWEARPWTARAIRAAVVLVPLAFSLSANRLLLHFVGRPSGLPRLLLWIGMILVVSFVVYELVHRKLARLLPLASLMNMTLVFPDQAPSRFTAALRGESAKQLARRIRDREELPTPTEAAVELVGLISRLSEHDRRTRGHSERVRAYSDVIAEQMKLSGEDREKLHWAALLHDVGKLLVPAEVLNKPGRPDEREWEMIRRHPAEAEALLRGMAPWLGDWVSAATEHHERYDGTGYPRGVTGAEIGLGGRIVAVADAYDVMTSSRSYKKPLPLEAARMELVRNAGTQFDPVVVRAFLSAGLEPGRRGVGVVAGLAEMPGLLSGLGAKAAAGAATFSATAGVAVVTAVGAPAAPAPPPADPAPVVAEAPPALSSRFSPTTTTVVVVPLASGESQGVGTGEAPAPSTSTGPDSTTTSSTSTSTTTDPGPTTTSTTTGSGSTTTTTRAGPTSSSTSTTTTTTTTTSTTTTTTSTTTTTTTTTSTTTTTTTTTTAVEQTLAANDGATMSVVDTEVEVYVLVNDFFPTDYKNGSL
ncbi:MAG TPA: HD-GYP domain-containing protein, partial [Acidimicrobiales bacterium]|nr:HD-GYP domain-containing protein [Acidimicrobiales bacterium]